MKTGDQVLILAGHREGQSGVIEAIYSECALVRIGSVLSPTKYENLELLPEREVTTHE